MTAFRTLTIISAAGAAVTLALAGCSGSSAPPTARHQLARDQVILAATGIPETGTATSPGTVTTVGTGTVTGAPDTLMIGVGVSTTASHASAALAQNNDLSTKVQQALARDGIERKDIQTAGLSLQDAYPASNGYQAFDEVTATVRNLGSAGTIIDDALQAAGDAGRLEMVNFSMSSTDPYMASARQAAVTSAKAEAEQLVTAAGEHLGALVSMTDQQSPVYPPPYGAAQGAAAAAPPVMQPVPVQPGSQQVTVSVTTVWAIAP